MGCQSEHSLGTRPRRALSASSIGATTWSEWAAHGLEQLRLVQLECHRSSGQGECRLHERQVKQYGWEYIVIDWAWYCPGSGTGSPNQLARLGSHHPAEADESAHPIGRGQELSSRTRPSSNAPSSAALPLTTSWIEIEAPCSAPVSNKCEPCRHHGDRSEERRTRVRACVTRPGGDGITCQG
jgi:hypothetical protein